jgi:hypothetical protein
MLIRCLTKARSNKVTFPLMAQLPQALPTVNERPVIYRAL